MTTPYVNPASIHDPATGTPIPASWGDAVNAGISYGVNPPGCYVALGLQTIPHNTPTVLNWTTADIRDTDNYHAANSHLVTIPTGLGGLYTLSFYGYFGAKAGGMRSTSVSIGATVRTMTMDHSSATGVFPVNWTLTEYMSPGETAFVTVEQSSGSDLDFLQGRLSVVSLARF